MAGMAETDSNANNLIQSVASAGEGLSISLLRFASKWDSGQQYITDVGVTASTIASLLYDIQRIIHKHGGDWQNKNVIHIICEGIKADFEKVAGALERAELKAGPGRFVTRVAKRFTPLKAPGDLDWDLFVEDTRWNAGMPDQGFLSKRPDGTVLLRAELELDPFALARLEEAKNQLWYLFEGFRFLNLRKLQKE